MHPLEDVNKGRPAPGSAPDAVERRWSLPPWARRVLVLGAGRSGIGAALALASRGLDVYLSDSQDARSLPGLEATVAAGVHFVREESLTDRWPSPNLVVKSPGIPADGGPVTRAREQGVPVWSEVELAYVLLPNPFDAITGTNGKTTTTALLGHLFSTAGRPARVLGNIGVAVTSAADEVGPDEELVVEVSSFQLEDVHAFRPAAGVFLNLTPDHLDRHGTMECYLACKARLFANQDSGDVAVLNLADPAIARLGAELAGRDGGPRVAFFSVKGPDPVNVPVAIPAVEATAVAPVAGVGSATASTGVSVAAGTATTTGVIADAGAPTAATGASDATAGTERGAEVTGAIGGGAGHSVFSPEAWVAEGMLFFQGGPLLPITQVRLPGLHNLENCLAAGTVALARGVSREAVAEGLRTFSGVPHRLEHVGTVAGITYVNDSKATNVDATLTALAAYPERTHLILGGRDKASDYRPIARTCSQGCLAVYLIGEAAPLIAEAFAEVKAVEGATRLSEPKTCGDLERAVQMATAGATPGDVVLLAPACASFDQYKNFEERGDHFRSIVKALAGT